jgi:glycosyltransferase involved in cell wall biosynthesis
MPPLISVVLATRDRPQLFEEALDSVLNQHFDNFEVVVVNDGSSPECLTAYQAIWDRAAARLGPRFSAHSLVHRPKGHGQSYSLNFGTSRAQGEYVCFLDDDDKWTDMDHLARAAAAITVAAMQGRPVDMYMANQDAWINEGKRIGTLWLGSLEAELKALGRQADAQGCYPVSVDELMASTGFCHLNCLTVRKAVFDQVGGMDEGVRWECDRDIFLKLIEQSQRMLHHPKVMSYHRVPDPTKTNNMTTALGMAEKRLLQTIVLDRAVIRSHHPAIVQHARLHKGYALKKIAGEYAQKGDWHRASFYARQAQGATPSLKWWLFTLQCMVRSAMSGH